MKTDLSNSLPHISFVILHYVKEQDTINCVDSILNNIDYKNISIVIVDNASPNDSGQFLRKRYQDSEYVTVILNSKNLGFARGNNIGFQYAKYREKADFILLLNNDTLINQSGFCNEILRLFSDTRFSVLGPKIISLIDGLNQNPVPDSLRSSYRVLRRLCVLILLYCLSLFHIDQSIANDPRKYHAKIIDGGSYQLYGCCLIFSPIYIECFDGLYSKTFMYGEEDILKYICELNNLKMLYSETLEIFHKEGSSTQSIQKTSMKSRRFYYKNAICSLFQLLLLRMHIKRMKKDNKKYD